MYESISTDLFFIRFLTTLFLLYLRRLFLRQRQQVHFKRVGIKVNAWIEAEKVAARMSFPLSSSIRGSMPVKSVACSQAV